MLPENASMSTISFDPCSYFYGAVSFYPHFTERRPRPRKEVTLPILHSQKVADLGFEFEPKAGSFRMGLPSGHFAAACVQFPFLSSLHRPPHSHRQTPQASSIPEKVAGRMETRSQELWSWIPSIPRGSPRKPPPGSSLLHKEGLEPQLRTRVPGAPPTHPAWRRIPEALLRTGGGKGLCFRAWTSRG